MANFTNITTGTDLQQVALINEIKLAWWERAYTRTGESAPPAYTPIVAGYDLQNSSSQAYGIGYFQRLAETTCLGFVDTNLDITDYGLGDSPLPHYTLSTWRTEAGLPSSGFRRATTWPSDWTNNNDPAYSYGYYTRGDIFGPWIFADLQKGFDAMRKTLTYVNDDHSARQSKQPYDDGDNDCATALSDWNSTWSSASWGSYSGNSLYRCEASSSVGPPVVFNGNRIKGTPVVKNINTYLPCSVDVYMIPYAPTSTTFNDIDGLGVGDEDHYWFYESLGSAQTSSRNCTPLNPNSGSNPVTEAGLGCPASGAQIGCEIRYTRGLCAFEYSHTLP